MYRIATSNLNPCYVSGKSLVLTKDFGVSLLGTPFFSVENCNIQLQLLYLFCRLFSCTKCFLQYLYRSRLEERRTVVLMSSLGHCLQSHQPPEELLFFSTNFRHFSLLFIFPFLEKFDDFFFSFLKNFNIFRKLQIHIFI